MTFRKGQYRSAAVSRPKELDRAEQLLNDGRGNEAVPLLKKVKMDCRFLAWDQKAILLLANQYFETGQFGEAVAEFQTLKKKTPDIQAKLRESMIQSGNTGALLADLEKDIFSGTREAAARAYLMRAELKSANGDPEGARRDWLKVATFFRAQKEIAKQAEEKLNGHEEAQDARRPDSLR